MKSNSPDSLAAMGLLIHFPCIALNVHCTLYLDFFDVLAATVVFPVSAGLFEPAWSFSLNDETCISETCIDNYNFSAKWLGKGFTQKGCEEDWLFHASYVGLHRTRNMFGGWINLLQLKRVKFFKDMGLFSANLYDHVNLYSMMLQ